MNPWIQLSIDYANQKSYLDDLLEVYPMFSGEIRNIDQVHWKNVILAFNEKNNIELIENLLKLKLFPIKDSYVAYLKRDKNSLKRNPTTTARLSDRLHEMGLDSIYARCSEPKETNRQIGPLFRRWLNKKSLGVEVLKPKEFLLTKENAILDGGDAVMSSFAREHLNYKHSKGLDFVGKFNGKYIIGEAKFLTDFGGHQNAQFNDAISTLNVKGVKAIKVAILDGVLYIKGNSKMYREITTIYKDKNIMSSLVFKEFLNQI